MSPLDQRPSSMQNAVGWTFCHQKDKGLFSYSTRSLNRLPFLCSDLPCRLWESGPANCPLWLGAPSDLRYLPMPPLPTQFLLTAWRLCDLLSDPRRSDKTDKRGQRRERLFCVVPIVKWALSGSCGAEKGAGFLHEPGAAGLAGLCPELAP